jgi:hypothetical protein
VRYREKGRGAKNPLDNHDDRANDPVTSAFKCCGNTDCPDLLSLLPEAKTQAARRKPGRHGEAEGDKPIERNNPMLMTIATILIILWLLGLVTSSTMGGLIHVLLVIAIIMVLVRLIQGRRIL